MKKYLACLIAATFNIAGCSVLDDMKHMKKSTDHVAQNTDDMAQKTDAMAANTKSMESTTEGMAAKTTIMAQTTQTMSKTTQEMAGVTTQLNATTQSMAQTTQGLAQTTQQMKNETDDLYHDLRQGNSATVRGKALEEMAESQDQLAKIGYASQYYMAFEFELWKANVDSDKNLDMLRRDACDEFLRIVQNYLPENRSDVSPNHSDEAWKNLYALAAGLHMINSNSQGETLSSNGGMLELLRKGLAAKSLVDRGVIAIGDLPEYQRKVLDFADDVALLLNIRANFIASMVINQIGVESQLMPAFIPGAGEKHIYLTLLEKLRIILSNWTGHLEQRNVGELTTFVELMDFVAETRQILRDAGVVIVTDDNLTKIAGNLVLPDPDSLTGLSEAKRTAITSLKHAMDLWRSHNDWRSPLTIDQVAGAAALSADYVAVVDLYTDALLQGEATTIVLKAQDVSDLSTFGLGRKVSSINVRYLKPGFALRLSKAARADLIASNASYVASAVGHDDNVGLSHQGFNDGINTVKAEPSATP